MPDGMDSESKQVLRVGIKDITDEYEHDSLYEGKFDLVHEILKDYLPVIRNSDSHYLQEVLEYLKDLLAERRL